MSKKYNNFDPRYVQEFSGKWSEKIDIHSKIAQKLEDILQALKIINTKEAKFVLFNSLKYLGFCQRREYLEKTNNKKELLELEKEQIDVFAKRKEKYRLTGNQKRRVNEIVSEVGVARKVVDALKEKYGVKDGEIADKKRLYKLIYGEEAPKEDFYVIPYGFSLGFYLPKSYILRDHEDVSVTGDSNGGSIFPKEDLRNDLKKLKNEKPNCNGLQFICFRVANKLDSYKKKGASRHELKHLIDNFCSYSGDNAELSAYVFDSDYLDMRRYEYGILQDIDNCKKELEKRNDKYNKLKELSAPEVIIKGFLGITNKRKKMLEMLEKFPVELVRRVSRKLGNQLTSYIIGTNKSEKLEKRLKMIDELPLGRLMVRFL